MSDVTPTTHPLRQQIADQVRRHCTPPAAAYAKGGDTLVAAVADWIENPEAWVTPTPFEAAPTVHDEPAPPATLLDPASIDDYFEDIWPEAIAVRDAHGVLYLLSQAEDGAFYVGIPQAEDEDGDEIDPNNSWINRPAPGKYGPTYPLTVLATGAGCFATNPTALAEDTEQ
ncbi:hypothetical protein ACYX8G_19580 [Microbacterium saperdae]